MGVFGISYPGFYSTLSIPDDHPALKAVSPQAPVTNWFIGDDFHHQGHFFLWMLLLFFFQNGFGRPRPHPIRERLDEFWKSRDPRQHLTNIKPAVLVVGGWFDAEELFGLLNVYKSIEDKNPVNQNRLVMGPWSHGQWPDDTGKKLGNIHWGGRTSDYFKEMELTFFNYYLKEEGNMDLPEASIFITGSNEWQDFNSWPPENTENVRLFLKKNNHLSFSAPKVSSVMMNM